MKKIVLSALILMNCFAVSAFSAKHQPGKSDVAKAFKEAEVSDDGMGFALSLKHVEAGKYIAPGSIKALQIFPVNTVTGGFTYDFS